MNFLPWNLLNPLKWLEHFRAERLDRRQQEAAAREARRFEEEGRALAVHRQRDLRDNLRGRVDREADPSEKARLETELRAEDEKLTRNLKELTLDEGGATQRGKAHFFAGRYEEALAAYDRALKGRPNDADALLYRGLTLHRLGRDEQALRHFERALELRPDDPWLIHNHGAILQAVGRPDEALAAYDRALVLRPDYALAYFNRAMLLGVQGKADQAIDDLRRAIDWQPQLREEACTGSRFHSIRDDARFRALVGEGEAPPEAGSPSA